MRCSKADVLEERRRQILDAALSCFARRGLHETAMHDISGAANISVGLIYRYFPSKEAVVAALAEDHERQVRALLETASSAPTLIQAIELFFLSSPCAQSGDPLIGFMYDLFAAASRNREMAGLVARSRNLYIEVLSDLISRAPERENLSSHLSIRDAAELILSAYEGARLQELLENRGPNQLDQQSGLRVAKQLWNVLFEPAAATAATPNRRQNIKTAGQNS